MPVLEGTFPLRVRFQIMFCNNLLTCDRVSGKWDNADANYEEKKKTLMSWENVSWTMLNLTRQNSKSVENSKRCLERKQQRGRVMPVSRNNNQSFHLLSTYCVLGALCALSLILRAGTMNYPFLIRKDEKHTTEKLSKTLKLNTWRFHKAIASIETHLIPVSVLCACLNSCP